jgi:nitroreductase
MSTSFPPIINMFSTGWFRRAIFVVVFASATARSAFLGAQTAPANAATLFRVFLRDGSVLVSYGEFARVADRVIVTMPLGSTDVATPDLEVLSIPAETVDWEKTDAYADSARAARYAETAGPNDFALLNDAVSIALNDIGQTADPARKIAMATEARQNVMKWASEHYGYRAKDVARLATLFDDVIAETRRANGEVNTDLSMVANLAVPPDTPLLPAPTLQETVEQALRAVTLAPDATARTSLLTAIERTLEGAGANEAWAAPLKARAGAALEIERRTDRVYGALTHDALRAADRYAAIGDVTSVERTIRALLKQDDRLGQRRPQEMAAALSTLDARLEAARQERLARDNRAARAVVVAQYRHAIAEPLAIVRRERSALDEIRRLAGPSPARLTELTAAMARAKRLLGGISVPEEVSAAHSLLNNAVQLAVRAADGRQRAVLTRSMQAAQEASSAAAGAIMLFERASADLEILTK